MTDATSVQPFDFNGNAVRVVLLDGDPWWVAADVCSILGIVNVADALTRLGEANIGSTEVPNANGQARKTRVINEPGLYRLVLRSDKPQAEPFIDWVTADVLPEIRRTGRYEAKPLTDLEIARRHLAAVEERERLRLELEAAQPKVEAYERFLDSDGTCSMATAAQMCGTGQNRLYAILRERGVLITGGDRHNTPYQRHVDLFKVIANPYELPDGTTRTSYTTKVKPSGLDFILRMLTVVAA